MSRALLALALLVGPLLAAAPASKKKDSPAAPPSDEKKSFDETACGSQNGLLLRVKGEPETKPDFAALGLQSVGGGSAYHMPAGGECSDRLVLLRRATADIEVTGAPQELPKDGPQTDALFKNAPSLRLVSRVQLSSQEALNGLFTGARARSDNAIQAMQELANRGQLSMGAVPPDRVVRADVADPEKVRRVLGMPASDFRVPQRLTVKATPPVQERHSDETDAHSYPSTLRGQFDRFRDWAYRDQRRDQQAARDFSAMGPGTIPIGPQAPTGPAPTVRTVGDWAEMPAAGPGFKFTGHGRYGTKHLVSSLVAAAGDKINGNGAAMSVVAISLWPPGTYFPPHKTHRNGVDVDVALSGRSWWGTTGRERDLRFALAVMEHMKPKFILLDTARQGELRAVADKIMGGAAGDAQLKTMVSKHYRALFQSADQASGAARGSSIFTHVEKHESHFHIQTTGNGVGR